MYQGGFFISTNLSHYLLTELITICGRKISETRALNGEKNTKKSHFLEKKRQGVQRSAYLSLDFAPSNQRKSNFSMNKMKFTVRGVIFALFPKYDQTDPRGREMVEETVQRLKQLNEERPEVVLLPEPENLKDRRPSARSVGFGTCAGGQDAERPAGHRHTLKDVRRMVGHQARIAACVLQSGYEPAKVSSFPR